MLTMSDVLSGLKKHLVYHSLTTYPEERSFTGVAIDSRQVSKGNLFIALHGEREDGHDHIEDALKRQAKGIVAERWPQGLQCHPGLAFLQVRDSLIALQALACHWRRKHPVEVIAITGSIGKTTTKEVVASTLARRYRVLKSQGNLNTEIGLPLTLLQLEAGYQKAVVEMGMYALGEIKALCQIAQPDIGIVTNVGHSHYQRLGSLEKIAQAKQELVESLPASGHAILNGDDQRVRTMAHCTSGSVIFYGQDPAFTIWASDVESRGLAGISFRLHWSGQNLSITSPLPGQHNLYALLAAAAVALVEGFDQEELVAALKEVNTHRLAVIPGMKGSTILDDTYNASPASTLAALDLLAEMKGRKVAVLGDMMELGDYEEEGHRQVGRRAAAVVNKLILVGPRARTIGEEALNAGLSQLSFATAKEEACQDLLKFIQPGDYILIKGSRAMAMETIVEKIKA